MNNKLIRFFLLAFVGFGVRVYLNPFAFNGSNLWPFDAATAMAQSSNSSSNGSTNGSSNSSTNSSANSSSNSSASGESTKITLCHIPPGNPENAQTLSISMSALQTHQDHHGDHLGACTANDAASEYSDGLFRIKINVPVKINAAQNDSGSTDLTASDFAAWTSAAAGRTSTSDAFPWPSGYASAWNSVATYLNGDKDPRGKSLSSYADFGQYEDMPALMLSGGVIDLHASANISGVVYTPNLAEIEQKAENNEVQYINGSIIGGNGIYFESNSCGGGIGVIFDPSTIDALNVNPTSVDALKRKGLKSVE